MDDRIGRIESKIDKILEHAANADVTLARLTVTVEEHEKRSTTLEGVVLPMQKYIERQKGALKLIAQLGIIAGIVEVILRLVGKN